MSNLKFNQKRKMDFKVKRRFNYSKNNLGFTKNHFENINNNPSVFRLKVVLAVLLLIIVGIFITIVQKSVVFSPNNDLGSSISTTSLNQGSFLSNTINNIKNYFVLSAIKDYFVNGQNGSGASITGGAIVDGSDGGSVGIEGVNLQDVNVQGAGTADDLPQFVDNFSEGINLTIYMWTGTNLNISGINESNGNGVILVNGSVVGAAGVGSLTTWNNLSLDNFNLSVDLNLSNTSSTLSAGAVVGAGVFIVNQTNTSNSISCKIFVNTTGYYLNLNKGLGESNNFITSISSNGIGTIRMEYINSTQFFNCSFGSTSLNTTSTEVGDDYGIGFKADIGPPFPSPPTGDVYVTFDNLTYSLGQVSAVTCGNVSSSITLTNNITAAGTCFQVNSSNIVIDGAGYTVQGNNTGTGIVINGFNNVTVKNLGITNFTSGIAFVNSVNDTIFNNTIQNVDQSALDIGTGTNTLINITSNYLSSSNNIIDIQSGSSNMIIVNNTIVVTSFGALNLNGGNNLVRNNIISGTASSGNAFINIGTNNNIFENNIINQSGVLPAIRFFYGPDASNNTFTSDTIIALSALDIITAGAGTGTNYFYNVSLNRSDVSIDQGALVFGWIVNVNVTNTTGSALANASAVGYTLQGTIDDNETTVINGFATLKLGEYRQNSTTTTYTTPHTINTSLSGYVTNSSSVNLTVTNNTQIDVILNIYVDITPPTFTEALTNQTIEYGSELIYDVNATDNVAIANYSINDTTNFAINQSGVITNATMLTIGTYGLNVTVNDTSGNTNSSIFFVIVQDTIAPTFVILTNTTLEAGTALGVQFNASDISGISSWNVNDTTNFAINSTGFLINATALTVQTYWLNVTVNDTRGNNNSRVIFVNVTTPPTYNLTNSGFETGDLTGWQTGGDASWSVQTQNVSEGTYAAKAGTILGSQLTWINQTVNVTQLSDLRFFWKVSSENTFDFLIFCLNLTSCDGVTYTDRISGSIDWTLNNFTVNSGMNLLQWAYLKDGTVDDGLDTGWIDNITITAPQAPIVYVNCSVIENSTTLNTNITVNGTCFTVNTSNIIIDGAGYTITGNGSGYGIDVTSFQNVTIKNLNVVNFSSGVTLINVNSSTISNNLINNNAQYGILTSVVIDSTFENNSLFSNGLVLNGKGILFDGAINNNITNNTLTYNFIGINLASSSNINNTFNSNIVTNSSSGGLYLSSGNSNYFINNTLNYNTNYGLSLGAPNNIVINNTIQENDGSDLVVAASVVNQCNNNITNNVGSGNRRILFYNYSVNLSNENNISELILCNADYSNLTNITVAGSDSLNNNGLRLVLTDYSIIADSNSSNNAYGIALTESLNNTLSGNIAFSNAPTGISLALNSENNTIINNNVRFNTIGVDVSSNNNLLQNNVVVQSSSGITPYYSRGSSYINNTILNCSNGFSFTGASNNSFINNTLQGNNPGFALTQSNNNTIIGGSTIGQEGMGPPPTGVGFAFTDSNNNIITNVSFNGTTYSTVTGTGTNYVKWYLITNVTNTSGSALQDVNVSAYYVNGSLEQSSLTLSDGSVTQTLTEFYQNSSGAFYLTPYTINSTLVNYTTNSTIVNLSQTGGTQLNVILSNNDIIYPTFTESLTNQTIEYGSAFMYDVNATDNVAIANYSINDTSNFVINSSGVIINATLLAVGTYGLNVTVNDTSGNTNSSIFFVIVQDTTAPTIVNVSNITLEYGSALGIQFNATDLVNISGWNVNDTSNFAINSTGFLRNATGLALQTYWLNVSVNDTSGNNNSRVIFVNVTDTTAPTIVDISNITLEYGTALGVQFNATDLSGISGWSVNDTSNFAINATGYLRNATALSVQTYWLNVTVNDTRGNNNSRVIFVNVTDTVTPTFTQSLTNQTLEYGSAFIYDVNATDNVAIANYSINDTTNFAINSSGVITNATLLAVGTYGLNVTVNDTSGNTNSSIFFVTVQDTISPVMIINGPTGFTNQTTAILNISTNENAICQYKNSTASYAVMNNTGNTTHLQNISLTLGNTLYTVLCNDTSGNNANKSLYLLRTDTAVTRSNSSSVTLVGNNTNTTSPISTLNITLNVSSTLGTVLVFAGEFSSNPEQSAFAISGYTVTPFKYLTVDALAVLGVINKIMMRFTYNETELSSVGISESDLKVYYYNVSADVWQQESEYIVNSVGNYVEVNVTHLSTFAFGKAVVTSASPSSSSGGGGSSSSVSSAVVSDIPATEHPSPVPDVVKKSVVETPPVIQQPIPVKEEVKQPVTEEGVKETRAQPLVGGAYLTTIKAGLIQFGSYILIGIIAVSLLGISSYSFSAFQKKRKKDRENSALMGLKQSLTYDTRAIEPSQLVTSTKVLIKPSLDLELEQVANNIKSLHKVDSFVPKGVGISKVYGKEKMEKGVLDSELQKIERELQGYPMPKRMVLETPVNKVKYDKELTQIEQNLSSLNAENRKGVRVISNFPRAFAKNSQVEREVKSKKVVEPKIVKNVKGVSGKKMDVNKELEDINQKLFRLKD